MTPETHSKELNVDLIMSILSRLGLYPERDEQLQNKFYCKCGNATYSGNCLEGGFFTLAYDMIAPDIIPVDMLTEVSNDLNSSNHLVKISVIPVLAPSCCGAENDFNITRFEISSINLTAADLEKNICSYISYINEVVSLFKAKILQNDSENSCIKQLINNQP